MGQNVSPMQTNRSGLLSRGAWIAIFQPSSLHSTHHDAGAYLASQTRRHNVQCCTSAEGRDC
jgi:hypothetical protein